MHKDNSIIKKERFKRLAEARTNEIIRKIKILGNCSNKSMYSYNESEVRKIFNAIENELKISKSRFRFSKKDNKFKL